MDSKNKIYKGTITWKFNNFCNTPFNIMSVSVKPSTCWRKCRIHTQCFSEKVENIVNLIKDNIKARWIHLPSSIRYLQEQLVQCGGRFVLKIAPLFNYRHEDRVRLDTGHSGRSGEDTLITRHAAPLPSAPTLKLHCSQQCCLLKLKVWH